MQRPRLESARNRPLIQNSIRILCTQLSKFMACLRSNWLWCSCRFLFMSFYAFFCHGLGHHLDNNESTWQTKNVQQNLLFYCSFHSWLSEEVHAQVLHSKAIVICAVSVEIYGWKWFEFSKHFCVTSRWLISLLYFLFHFISFSQESTRKNSQEISLLCIVL